jgi:signal transduction histidine kinase
LLSNAIKFSEENPLIEISAADATSQEIRNYGLNNDKAHVKITFRDHGIGFEPKYADDVFKLFKRLHDIDTGTGIGLSLCKRVVENHGGHISVSSQPQKGTTFYIILPVS